MGSVVRGKECSSIERGGLEFPKQLNCSSKCFFEQSGKDSNPITSQLTTLSEERFQKALTPCSINLRHTIAICLGTEVNNDCQGQNGASWLNSFIPSPESDMESILDSSTETVFLWNFLCWMELLVEPPD